MLDMERKLGSAPATVPMVCKTQRRKTKDEEEYALMTMRNAVR